MGACVLIAVLGVACTSSSDPVADAQASVSAAQQAVVDAQTTLTDAEGVFCTQAHDYILAVDRYGKLFSDSAATVGDVRTLGADLAEPRASTVQAAQAVVDARDSLTTANQQLLDAHEALVAAQESASAPVATPSPAATAPSPSPLPEASIDSVKQAEAALTAAEAGITDSTPVRRAGEVFTSAAFAVQAAWLRLYSDSGCLTDQQAEKADTALRDYTAALQSDLKKTGYYKGEVDGIYGPKTVAAVEQLQRDAGLPVTGLVDQATSAALNAAVAKKEGKKAAQSSVETAALQTALSIAGYWNGPIDGQWTRALTGALEEFQVDAGLEPTGKVDAETLAALEEITVGGPAATPSPGPSPSPSATPAGPSPSPVRSPSSRPTTPATTGAPTTAPPRTTPAPPKTTPAPPKTSAAPPPPPTPPKTTRPPSLPPPATAPPSPEGSSPPPAAELVGPSWQWTGLVRTNPEHQSVVPTPEDYTLTLHSDGTFAARADCNEASGTYISDEVAISLLVETTTTKECGPGSLGTEFLHLFSEVAAYRIAGTEMTFGLVDEAGGAAGEMTFSIAAA